MCIHCTYCKINKVRTEFQCCTTVYKNVAKEKHFSHISRDSDLSLSLMRHFVSWHPFVTFVYYTLQRVTKTVLFWWLFIRKFLQVISVLERPTKNGLRYNDKVEFWRCNDKIVLGIEIFFTRNFNNNDDSNLNGNDETIECNLQLHILGMVMNCAAFVWCLQSKLFVAWWGSLVEQSVQWNLTAPKSF